MRRIVVLVCVLVPLAVPVSSEAAMAAQCDVPSAMYPTIQDAVDDGLCNPINLAAGTFAGFNINRAVTVVGAGAEVSFIQAPGLNAIQASAAANLVLTHVTVHGSLRAIRSDQGSVTVEDSVLRDNGGDSGGAIYAFDDGSITVRRTLVSGNSATAYGGAIDIDPGASLAVEDSALIGNEAALGGGGIDNTGTATLTNTTMSGNHTPIDGGAIFSNGDTYLNNVTITNNTADDDASGDGQGGGLISFSGLLKIRNSILAGNHDGSPGAESPDCGPEDPITSDGHNIVGTDAGCVYLEGAGDQVGADPNLLPLGDYGGSTPTNSPIPGSPAIDGVPANACLTIASVAVGRDQRGVTRPFDGDGNGSALCDIGAVEWAPRDIELTAKDKVRKGAKVTLTAEVSPCAGHEGDVVHFMKKSKELAAIPLDADCTVSSKAKVKKKTTFSALLDAEPDHPADADAEKVKVKKPR